MVNFQWTAYALLECETEQDADNWRGELIMLSKISPEDTDHPFYRQDIVWHDHEMTNSARVGYCESVQAWFASVRFME